jgi:carbon starvation protein CstA
MGSREDDCKRLWILFGLMNVINGALLALVTTKELKPELAYILVLSLGILITFLWWATSMRMVFWIQWWELKLREVERATIAYLDESESKDVKLSGGIKIFIDRDETENKKGISTKFIACAVPVLFMVVWIVLLLDETGLLNKIHAIN